MSKENPQENMPSFEELARERIAKIAESGAEHDRNIDILQKEHRELDKQYITLFGTIIANKLKLEQLKKDGTDSADIAIAQEITALEDSIEAQEGELEKLGKEITILIERMRTEAQSLFEMLSRFDSIQRQTKPEKN